MHASLCVPNGKALLSPLIALVGKGNNKPNTYMKLDEAMTLTSIKRLACITKSSNGLTDALHRPSTGRPRLQQILQFIGNECRRSMVWNQETTPTNHMENHIPTGYPTSNCIRIKPDGPAHKFQLGNGRNAMPMAGT